MGSSVEVEEFSNWAPLSKVQELLGHFISNVSGNCCICKKLMLILVIAMLNIVFYNYF